MTERRANKAAIQDIEALAVRHARKAALLEAAGMAEEEADRLTNAGELFSAEQLSAFASSLRTLAEKG